jgi:hypothetical protein
VDRRRFLGQVVFATAAVAVNSRPSLIAQPDTGGLAVKFVGMMGYITRSDRSVMVAMPGSHALGHYSHVPFLMARSGSAIATALGMTSMPGVAAGAFDMSLADAPSGAFVYRCLDGCDLEIVSANGAVAVDNRATQIAQMQAIAPGKRLRSNLRRWAQSTVTIQGGVLTNSAAHPDAGKTWSFGDFKQKLTDATLYRSDAATVRMAVDDRVLSFAVDAAAPAKLWIVSAAGPRTDPPNPKRLEHGRILFEYLDDAAAIVPTCDEAEGRITLATELPCAAQTASTRGGASITAPPYTEFCPGGGWCAPCD